MSKFTIDFFELAFLAEACIPPTPIARSKFWSDLTDRYWEQMTEEERVRLFEWLNKDWRYKKSLEEQEETRIFHSRFDPDNQYTVTAKTYIGKELKQRAFKMGSRYYVGTNSWVAEELITSVEKLKI